MTQPITPGALFLPPEIESIIVSTIRQADRILCVSHVSPDGDAVGSLLGMGWILRHLGKQPTLALADRPSQNFDFIPGFDQIVDALPEENATEENATEENATEENATEENATEENVAEENVYDLIICLDSGSQDRMGSIYRPDLHASIPLLNIDHHITNTRFGAINWVEPRCAAACQMLVYLADALGAPLTGNLAVALLTGLVTDTLCFRTSSTDACVLQAAMRLTDGGASIQEVVDHTLNRRSYTSLRLWGSILSTVQVGEGVIWAKYPLAQREEIGAKDRDTEGLANFLLSAHEADISATFSERINTSGNRVIECSFRAKPGFDVSAVALALGGGGHAPAAGCTLNGPLDAVVDEVVAALRNARQTHLSTIQSNGQATRG